MHADCVEGSILKNFDKNNVCGRYGNIEKCQNSKENWQNEDQSDKCQNKFTVDYQATFSTVERNIRTLKKFP